MNVETPENEEYKAPKDHGELIRLIETAHSATKANAEEVKLDVDYFHGDQISARTRAELVKRGQPPIYTNKIAPAVRGLFGILDAASSDPEARPTRPSAQDAADVVTKTLRYVADKANLPVVKRDCSSNFIVEGCCAAIIEFDGRDINVAQIEWEDFIYDQQSRKHDFSDAKWLGVGKLMDREDVSAMFPDFDGEAGPIEDFGSFNDDAKLKFWGAHTRRLVRVCDVYYNHAGEWHRAIFTASQLLYSGVCEYVDEYGDTFCPIVATSWEVNRSRERVGAVRDMRPLQDEFNARRSRMLHLTNHRQVKQTQLNAPPANREIAIREAAKADGAIPYGWDSIPTPDMAQGQMLLLQQTEADLSRMAPTPAVLGQLGSGNQSGRARQVLQQAGYTELARAFGRFEQFELDLYRKLWFVARQYLDQPMFIRIVDDPRAIDFLTINEPIMGMVQEPIVDAEGQPVLDPMTGRPAFEVKQGVVGYNNRIAELEMEIVLTTVPDTVTLQQEVFNSIFEYASATKMNPFSPEFQLVIEMSPMPNKREVIERLEAARQTMAQQQQPDPMAMEAAKLDLEERKAGIDKDQAKAFKDYASAEAQQAEMVRKGLGLN